MDDSNSAPVLDDPVSVEEVDSHPDSDVKRYETLDIKKVRAELREHGINPKPTIEAVNRLVASALAAWGRSGASRPRR